MYAMKNKYLFKLALEVVKSLPVVLLSAVSVLQV